jgi:hypothetical protein
LPGTDHSANRSTVAGIRDRDLISGRKELSMLAALIWIGGPLLFGLIVAAITGGSPEVNPVAKHLEKFVEERTPVLLEYGQAVYAVRVIELEQKLVGVLDGSDRYAVFPLDKVTLTVVDSAALLELGLRLPSPGTPTP